MGSVGIIGTGAVGSMLVRAHSRFGSQERFRIEAWNRSPERLEALRSAVPGLGSGAAVEAIAERASMLVLCLPAGPYLQMAAALAPAMRPGAVFVCVSSAVDLGLLSQVVARPIVRMVPSLAHVEGRGVSLLVPGPMATPDHVDLVRSFMEPMSLPMEVTEADARIATNVTGCGPAIFACFAEVLAETAARSATGLSRDTLEQMSAETLAGVAALLDASWRLPEITREVATGGGTTEAAVAVLRTRLPEVLEEMHQATFTRQAMLRKGRL
jgi:competence protein ComER